MVNFIMMVGVPGSGKSTEASLLAEEYDALVFSSDAYRETLIGDVNDQSHNQRVFDTLYEEMLMCIDGGRSAILDATNISCKDRMRALSRLGNRQCHKIACVMATDFEECVSRDSHRERCVGESIIRRFISRFEFPQRFEGFDEIIIRGKYVRDTCDNNIIFYNFDKVESMYKKMVKFDQKSKYHKYNLLKHSDILANSFDDVRNIAGAWHDVGKMFTQTFSEDGYAHYYNHANWSAYWLMCNLDVIESDDFTEVLEVLFFVNQHMHIRDITKSDKAVTKYKYIWGEGRFNDLYEFMVKDNEACGIDSKDYKDLKEEESS